MTVNVRHILAALLVLCAVSPAFAQMSEQEIRTRLDAVYAGKADQVSRELNGLLEQHPHDAGVLYLQAVLTNDGTVAVKRYQAIADTYPESPWADDALYKLYQYNFSLGLYKKADEVMDQLRSRYPQSIYASAADAKGATQAKAAAAPVQVQVEKPVEKKIEPVKKEAAPAAAQTSAPVEKAKTAQQTTVQGRFYVQVGVFSTEENARKAAEKYSGMAGRTASVTPKTNGDKTLYIVRFEGFESSESAHTFSSALRTDHNIDSFVFPTPNPNAH
jgi:cell division septation protein DedD